MREVVTELRKVVAPTEELITYTSVVLVFVVIMMARISSIEIVIGILTGFVFGSGTLPWTN